MRSFGILLATLLVGLPRLATATSPTMETQQERAQAFLDKLQGLDAEELAAAVKEIAAGDPDPLPTVFVGLIFWLSPHTERAAQHGFPDPRLDQAVSDAGRAIAGLGSAYAEQIASLLVAEDSDIVHDTLCASALEAFGNRAEEAIPILRKALDSESYRVRNNAAVGLAAIDGPDYPTLLAALESPRRDVRSSAVWGLGKTGSARALEPLMKALEDPELASVASDAIGTLGPVAAPAFPVLLASGRVSPSNLAKIGDTVIPTLMNALESEDEELRDRAGAALTGMGDAALPRLVEALEDPEPQVRLSIAQSIGRTGEGMESLTPALVALADDPNPRIRIAAITALSEIDSGEAGLSAVLQTVDDKNQRVGWEALVALGSFENQPEVARKVLLAHLKDQDRYFRAAAVTGLVYHYSGVAVYEELEPILTRVQAEDPNPEIRELASRYITSIKPGRAAPTEPGLPAPPPPPPPSPPRPPLLDDPHDISTQSATSPTPEASPPTPRRVGGSVPEPHLIKHVPPEYPEEARAARVQGPVILECKVGVDGRVSDIQIIRSVPLLDKAAVDAVRQWIYEPVVLDGAPVPVLMTVTVSFELD